MIGAFIIAGVVAILVLVGVYLKLLTFNPITYIVFIILSILGAYAILALAKVNATTDYEIWNGEIIKKEALKKDCQRGWNSSQDNFCTDYDTRSVYDGQICTTDSKGNQSCIPQYHTEYRYNFPWERRYFVYANLKNTVWEISRVDRQGAKEPPKFTETNIGDPASIMNAYTNYVKAASDSLFHQYAYEENLYKDLIPEYPIEIYDGWKVDRVLKIGLPDLDVHKMSLDLSIKLKDLGPKKQMNAIIILTDSKKADISFAYAVQKGWKGFKKNDAVIFIGLDGDTVAWSEVMSWSKESLFDVRMRNAILDLKTQHIKDAWPKIMDSLHDIGMKDYSRREMKEFEYLLDEIPIPSYYYVFAFLFVFVGVGVMQVANNKLEELR